MNTKIRITNTQKDAIVHACNRCRIPNMFFNEIMAVRNLCLGDRDWVEVAGGTIKNPNTVSEIELSPGEIKAVIALTEIAREAQVLEGVFIFPLDVLKNELSKGLESQKPKRVKSQDVG